MRTKGIKMLATLLFSLAVIGSVQAADADESVAALLNKIGMAYNIDQDGDYAIVIHFQDERSQLVFVRSAVYDSRGVAMRDIWSDGYVHENANIPNELQTRLLEENVGTVMGNWSREDNKIAYVVKLPADASLEQLRAGILEAAEQADELEKELLGSDDF